MRKLTAIFCLIVMFFFTGRTQVTVSSAAPYDTPANLVQNVLLGSGVTASNFTFYGDTNFQAGFFDASNSTFGLDSGIVLTTGALTAVPVGGSGGNPVQGPNSGGFGPAYMGSATNNNLLTVSQSVPGLLGQNFAPANSVNDACVLEFDFVPSSDTVKFRYIFASQEWNGFPCTQFNDVFGFFVAGPGLTGPYNAPASFNNGAINIANIPNTSPLLPVTISSIHPGGNACGQAPLNVQYYTDNSSPNIDIAFNGYTTILTATMATIPCDTYHIALAIGDGSDMALNSAVFIEANSFSANPVEVSAVPSYNTFGNDSNLYEGCGTVSLAFDRFADLQVPATVYFDVGGSAIEGVDYTNLPDSINFAGGQSTANVLFDIFDDGLVEVGDSLVITVFPDTTACYYSPGDTERVVLYLVDRPAVTGSMINDTVDCTYDSAYVTGEIVTGIPTLDFLWATGDSLDTLGVPTPNQDTTIYVSYTDACGVDTIPDSVLIVLENPQLSISTQPDSMDCTEDSLRISPSILSGPLNPNYVWSTGETSDSIWVSPVGDSVYYVTVTDPCNGVSLVDSIEVIHFDPPFTTLTIDDTLNCLQNFVNIGVELLSGTGPFNYQWQPPAFGFSDSIFVFPNGQDQTYYVNVTDQCQGQITDSISVVYFSPALEALGYTDTISCIDDSILIGPDVITGTFPTYLWDNGATTDSIWISTTTNTAFTVTVTDACDSVPDTVTVNVDYSIGDSLQASGPDTLTVPCSGDLVNVFTIPSGGIMPYSYSWSFGATDSTASVPVFNDTAVVLTISDTCGIQQVNDTIRLEVQTYQPLLVNASDTILRCSGDTLRITAEATGGAGVYTYSWQWTPNLPAVQADTLVIAAFNRDTLIQVTVTDFCGNTATDTIQVSFVPFNPMQLTLMPDTGVCGGQSVLLEANVTGGLPPVSLTWSGLGVTLIDSNYIQVANDPNYAYATATDGCGNSITDSVNVFLIDCSQFIPNVITPNGDGINDFFEIVDLERYPGSRFTVYNRWGQVLLDDLYYRNNWGGEGLPDGVYFWVLEQSNGGERLSGHVTLFNQAR